MKVIVFIDDDILGRTEPQIFASIEAMLKWFKDERGYEFPSGEDDELCLQNLREGKSFAYHAYYFGWHEVIS